MAAIVVVFDFDMTIIDCDSDDWVVKEMGGTHIFNRLRPILPWNSLMDRIMSELHSQGKTVEEIADCLKRVPLHPRMITAIKTAYALGCDLRIVSDANSFFIETILKHHGALEYFSVINSNPAFVDENGKLRILPYHDFNSSPHGCNLCPPNMCKRIHASVSAVQKKRFIYLGDGRGDFCPSTKLGEREHVIPRKNFPLWELISQNPMLVKAKVHEWSNAEDVDRILIDLIKGMSDEDSSSHMLSVECKFETIPIPSHEAIPQVLPIRH
ncbi:hypothetical protein ACLOJK_040053 [Asimina triloba]